MYAEGSALPYAYIRVIYLNFSPILKCIFFKKIKKELPKVLKRNSN
ncbi:MAG: hypothetical protein ACI8ZX_001566 [Planctomycetota bacterium]|jgi:hypothetical protein